MKQKMCLVAYSTGNFDCVFDDKVIHIDYRYKAYSATTNFVLMNAHIFHMKESVTQEWTNTELWSHNTVSHTIGSRYANFFFKL